MKKIVLAAVGLIVGSYSLGQNINDHKVYFSYIQLPLKQIDTKLSHYSVTFDHSYKQANEDSTNAFKMREEVAMNLFKSQIEMYYAQRDSLDKIHLTNLATWERNVNAGIKNPDGTELDRPAPPMYPTAPAYPQIEAPILHTDYLETSGSEQIVLAGYEKGEGEIEIMITLQPIRDIRIVASKKGTGSATKYTYSAQYVLPIGVKVASPSQGILLEETLWEGVMSYNMKEQTSHYDHELYMMENKENFHKELEAYARSKAMAQTSDYINSQFGFVEKTRVAEIYSVKSFKNHDYSDVTNAFTKTTFALQAVGNDRDRSGAMGKINEAITLLESILTESNISDNKSRINDKVTAMLQCNLAELYIWKGEFDQADALVNIGKNSGVGKAKRHLEDELGFYKDQRTRWEANY